MYRRQLRNKTVVVVGKSPQPHALEFRFKDEFKGIRVRSVDIERVAERKRGRTLLSSLGLGVPGYATEDVSKTTAISILFYSKFAVSLYSF